MKTFLNKVLDFFGLRHNSRYVKNYLNEANMRSGIFMSIIIIVLEMWLLIRQTNKYVIPQISEGTDFFKAVFTNTSNFWMLMAFGAAMLFFCIQTVSKVKSKKYTVLAIVFAGISLAVCALFPFEFHYNSIKFNTDLNTMKGVLKILFYASVTAFNIAVIIASINLYRGSKFESIFATLVISLFALGCLSFGIFVSYGDFVSSQTFDDGTLQHKQIICFLMMAIYVGCLLIWKPLISIGILGTIFLGFFFALDGAAKLGGRQLPEGDTINYITFFISLTMVCISIYSQRVSEAQKDEELELLATRDKLTGLYAYEYYITLIARKIESENLQVEEWIYLFMDITSFKVFNDQRGFQEGNEFLKAVGEILSNVFEDGLVSRQSDDHFVVFTKNENIEEKLDFVNNSVEKLDLDVRPGIKVGGYILRDVNEDPRQAVEKARYSCAELKKSAYGTFLKYDKEMHDNYRLVQYIVRHIDEAIEKGYIQPYYQPVVWSKGRKLCGVEALARWIDPKYGFLSPGTFVPALESAQLIHKLDVVILRIVCKTIRHNIDNGIPAIPASINFSRLDFKVMDVVKVIDDTLKEFNVDPSLLHIEITESALMDDEDVLKDAMKRLHGLGYAVWLDDFGSGYSSFNVLKDYEFDVLKLDMKFLSGFKDNVKARVLINSVVLMANEIGMMTLSEGVETKEEAEFLESVSCGRLQGYLYGKPLSYDELKKRIEEGYYSLSPELLK